MSDHYEVPGTVPWKRVPLPLDTSLEARRRVAERDKLIRREQEREQEHQRELNREAEGTPDHVYGLRLDAQRKARHALPDATWVLIVLGVALFLMAVGVIG